MTNDFEAELRSSLAAIPATPSHDLAQAANEGHHHRKKQRRLATLAATGCVAAAAGVTAGLVVTSAPAPAPLTTAYVVDHVTSALESSNTIGYSALRLNTGAQIDKWTHGETGRLVVKSPNGQLLEDTSATTTVVSAKETASAGRYVDYRDRIWRNISVSAVGLPQSGCEDLALDNPLANEATGPLFSVDWKTAIETSLKCGRLAVLGHQQLNGKGTIELQQEEPVPNNAKVPTRIWVDPKTYLPVRLALYTPAGKVAATATFSWLAPTKSNLGDLTAPIPSGFTSQQVAPDNGEPTPLGQVLADAGLEP